MPPGRHRRSSAPPSPLTPRAPACRRLTRSLADVVRCRQRRIAANRGKCDRRDRRGDAGTGAGKPRVALFAAPETSPAILFGLYDVLSTVGAVVPGHDHGRAGRRAARRPDRRRRSRAPFRCFGNVLVEPHESIDDATRSTSSSSATCTRRSRRRRTAGSSARPPGSARMHADGRPRQLGLHRLASARRSRTARRPDVRGPLGVRATCSTRSTRRSTFDGSAILVLASESDGVITAGGVTAWQDLALHVIARLLRAGARRPDGQGPPAHRPRGRPAAVRRDDQREDPNDAAVVRAQAWIADNYASDNPVAAMVERSGLSRGPSAGGSGPPPAAGRSNTSTRSGSTRRGGSSSRATLAVDEVGLQRRLRGPDLLPPLVQADDRPDAGGVPTEVRDDRPISRPHHCRRAGPRRGLTGARFRARPRQAARPGCPLATLQAA